MLNSQRIKLLATNNLEHLSLTHQKTMEQPLISIEDKLGIDGKVQYLNVNHVNHVNEFNLEGEQTPEKFCEEYSEEEEGNFVYDSYDTEELQCRGMFTIREEQSYQNESELYQEQQQKIQMSSDMLKYMSTIKVLRQHSGKQTDSRGREQEDHVQSFDIQDKNKYNATMLGSTEKSPSLKQTSTKTGDRSKYQQNQHIYQQQLLENNQQKTLSIDFNEIKLPVEKMKINSKLNILHNQDLTVKNQVGIIYECNQEEFMKVVKILEDEGIRVVKEPERIVCSQPLRQLKESDIDNYQSSSQISKVSKISRGIHRSRKSHCEYGTPILKRLQITKELTPISQSDPNTSSIILKKIHFLKPSHQNQPKKKGKGISMITSRNQIKLIR